LPQSSAEAVQNKKIEPIESAELSIAINGTENVTLHLLGKHEPDYDAKSREFLTSEAA
jgi:hypothetical protein